MAIIHTLILMRAYFILLVTLLFLNACQKNNRTQEQQESDPYLSQGKEIIQKMVGDLSGELKRAMRRGGVSEAVPYCNANALPITEKVATQYGATVRRTSIKNRNPKNAANTHEKLIIEQYEASLAAGKKLKPSITQLPNGNTMFNAPILLRASCLNCHGTVGKHISASDYQVIKSLYPNDKATGYKVAELRGIWSVVFEKK